MPASGVSKLMACHVAEAAVRELGIIEKQKGLSTAAHLHSVIV